MTTGLESSLVKCSRCQALLFPDIFNLGELSPCPSCQSLLDIEVFPAILNVPTAAKPESILVEGESSCFYHPDKKASIVCDGCGRFLCGLCDLELNNRHVCPVCLETGQKKSKYKDLENSRMLWDRLALSLTLLPLIVFYPVTIFTAPAALYIVIRHWNAPCSITGRSRVDFVVGGILAVLEIALWIVILVFFLTRKHS